MNSRHVTTIRLGPKGQAILKVLREVTGNTLNDVVFTALEKYGEEVLPVLRENAACAAAEATVDYNREKANELGNALRMMGK